MLDGSAADVPRATCKHCGFLQVSRIYSVSCADFTAINCGTERAFPFTMSKELHCYEYVNRPYAEVRDALVHDAVGVFERATQTAAGRASALVSNLKVEIAGLEVGKNVVIRVTGVHPEKEAPGRLASDAIRLDLEWHAETAAALFPSMRASLLAYPLSATETQLDLRGTYDPPGGLFGNAADRIIGHRIAEACVHRFLDEVASRLSQELT